MKLSRRSWLAASAVAAGEFALGGCTPAARPAGEVALWFSYGGRNRKVLLGLIDRFHREQQDVRVVPTFQGDYFEGLIKLRTGMFVGSVPTVTHVVGEVVPYLAAAGALASLEGVGPDLVNSLVPQLAQAGSFSGADDQELVALPFNRSTPICYYNKTVFDELKLSPPTNWQQMRQVAAQATVRKAGVIARFGFECPIDWWFWIALLGQAGGQVIEESGEVGLGLRAGERAIMHWQAMMHSDRSMKPPPGRDYNAWEATNSDFLSGRVAMIWTSTAFLRYLEENASFPVGAAPLPADVRHSVPTGGTFFVMPKTIVGDEQRAGLAFLRWMMQPQQANEWATSTGYMPVSAPGLAQLEREGFYEASPNFKVTLDQLADAQPWPWAPQLFRVQREIVQPRLESALLEKRDARELMDEARAAALTP